MGRRSQQRHSGNGDKNRFIPILSKSDRDKVENEKAARLRAFAHWRKSNSRNPTAWHPPTQRQAAPYAVSAATELSSDSDYQEQQQPEVLAQQSRHATVTTTRYHKGKGNNGTGNGNAVGQSLRAALFRKRSQQQESIHGRQQGSHRRSSSGATADIDAGSVEMTSELEEDRAEFDASEGAAWGDDDLRENLHNLAATSSQEAKSGDNEDDRRSAQRGRKRGKTDAPASSKVRQHEPVLKRKKSRAGGSRDAPKSPESLSQDHIQKVPRNTSAQLPSASPERSSDGCEEFLDSDADPRAAQPPPFSEFEYDDLRDNVAEASEDRYSAEQDFSFSVELDDAVSDHPSTPEGQGAADDESSEDQYSAEEDFSVELDNDVSDHPSSPEGHGAADESREDRYSAEEDFSVELDDDVSDHPSSPEGHGAADESSEDFSVELDDAVSDHPSSPEGQGAADESREDRYSAEEDFSVELDDAVSDHPSSPEGHGAADESSEDRYSAEEDFSVELDDAVSDHPSSPEGHGAAGRAALGNDTDRSPQRFTRRSRRRACAASGESHTQKIIEFEIKCKKEEKIFLRERERKRQGRVKGKGAGKTTKR